MSEQGIVIATFKDGPKKGHTVHLVPEEYLAKPGRAFRLVEVPNPPYSSDWELWSRDPGEPASLLEKCPTCGGTREFARMLGGKSLDTDGTGRCADSFHRDPEEPASPATPLPWNVVGLDEEGDEWGILGSANWRGTAEAVADNLLEDDARYIVEACNAYPELRAEVTYVGTRDPQPEDRE